MVSIKEPVHFDRLSSGHSPLHPLPRPSVSLRHLPDLILLLTSWEGRRRRDGYVHFSHDAIDGGARSMCGRRFFSFFRTALYPLRSSSSPFIRRTERERRIVLLLVPYYCVPYRYLDGSES